jgi:hexosaminidase
VIIPRPAELVAEPGGFAIGPQTAVVAAPGAERPAALLARALGLPVRPADVDADADAGPAIRLTLDAASDLPSQGYELVVHGDAVEVTAPDEAGLFHGVQTVRHLVDPENRLPGLTIRDAPRLPWRGALLDVARHFWPLEFLREFVDLLAAHKLNVLHLHLTDDQGWRIEIDGLPDLTRVGAWRTESMVGPAGGDRFDGVPHGGFYTQAELRALVAYAAGRGVTIVPEIGMPGHVQALLAAYPELGNDPARQLPVWTGWGISEHILGVHDEVFETLTAILDQVLDVFPSPFIHIGGDECPTVEWEASPRARARAAELGLSSPARLHGWFLERVQQYLAGRGRRTISWAEAELHGDLGSDMVLSAWLDVAHGGRGVERGHQVLMTAHTSTYLDYPQSDDPSEPPGNPKEVVTLADVYAFDPLQGGLPVADLDGFAPGVLGTQAQLWAEHITTAEHARYLLLPRLCALAEVAWSRGERDLAEFEQRLPSHLARIEACVFPAATAERDAETTAP